MIKHWFITGDIHSQLDYRFNTFDGFVLFEEDEGKVDGHCFAVWYISDFTE